MSLPVSIRVADAVDLATPALFVPVFQASEFPSHLAALDRAIGGGLAAAWASGDFTGKTDETVLVHGRGTLTRIVLLGMGEVGKTTASTIRRAAMSAGKRARTLGVPTAAFLVPDAPLAARDLGRAIGEGLPYGAWYYGALKRPAKEPKPELSALEVVRASADSEFAAGVEVGLAISEGQAFTRGLQVLPSDVCTPAYLAEQAEGIASRHGMQVTVLDKAGLEREGMGAILAVGKGSVHDPRFIVLEYTGGEGAPIVLIGKGVTFDAGGISIKPAAGMEEMKYDMSGAAAVLGTMEVIGRLQPKVNVVALVPSAENMVSGSAYRPGDVVHTHLGKTIEVLNTDAEGRLLLADALSWAHRYEPAAVIDCATLTGAVVIALGHAASAVVGTDADLVRDLISAGESTGERLWELPLWDDYFEHIKSDIADMKNTGGRPAGTLTAAMLLREFAEGMPWAHIDIAGTAYTDRDRPTHVKGPTGVLVRLFSEFVLARA
ncbi:MAG TPA: leucyl aminopeptidase [Gemmatimonadales bacterium]|nr:leucyl aminopeptidase [Gemmatimonadales bacterium]